MDIATIRDTLRDRVPKTAHQLINRVGNRHRNKPRTAAVVKANWEINDTDLGSDEADTAIYTLGKRYGCDAKGSTKNFGAGRGKRKEKVGGTAHNNEGMEHKNIRTSLNNGGQGRRLNSRWMRGVKGCFVRGQ